MDVTPSWPARTMAETYALLCAPGAPFEMREEVVGGVRMRTYVRAMPTLRAVFDHARRYDDRVYIVHGDDRVTFAAHARAAVTLAAAMTKRFGIAKGDRVALAMRNLPEWIVTFWAAVGCGAVIVPVNAWGQGADLAHAIRDSGATLMVVDADRLERMRPHLGETSVRTILAARTPPNQLGDALPLEELLGTPRDYAGLDEIAFPDPGLLPDDDATIFYTSGTTGEPKGALGSHRAIATNLVNIGLRTARAALRRGEPLPIPDPAVQRTTLLPTPLFHVTGTHSGIVPAMLAGTKVVLMHKWEPAEALRLIEAERANAIVTVPTMSWQLVDPALAVERDLSSLDTITFGGAPAAPELLRLILDRFPGRFVANGFGMTETSSIVSSNSAEDFAAHPDSVGTAMPCNDLLVVDEHDREVPLGEPGELIVRGPNVIKGYWRRPHETAETIVDGWLRTGDIVRIDDEGFIYALDRAKDMIIRGGENVYCVEVEAVLAQHPDIAEVAVIGLPDRVLGETVAAAIVAKPGAGADHAVLDAFARARMAGFKAPARYLRVADALPRNVAGKVLKRELKAMLARGEIG